MIVASAQVHPLEASRRIAIYTTFVEALPLTDAHREHLATARGLNDDVIDRLKFRSGGNRKAIEQAIQATGATEEELLLTGLCSRFEGKILPNVQLLKPSKGSSPKAPVILIPYLDRDGARVLRIRPHKGGFAKAQTGLALEWYAPYLTRRQEPLIITEGEFKAAALHQLGYSAIGLPGISSFGGQHLEKLKKAVATLAPTQVIICFDHEIKDDPLRYPKSAKDDFWDAYDTEVWSCKMAWHLRQQPTRIARLPVLWMDDKGKADCDGALAMGKGRLDFDAVFAKAQPLDRFLHELSGNMAVVVRRKVADFVRKPGDPRLTERRSLTEGFGYQWTKPGDANKPPETTVISNFLLEPVMTVYTDSGKESLVRMHGRTGDVYDPVVLTPGDMTPSTAFERWCHAQGPYTWSGGGKHLRALWEWLDAKDRGTYIRRTVFQGEIEPDTWVFQNAVLRSGKLITPHERDGVCWDGRHGYTLDADEEKQPRLTTDAQRTTELDDHHGTLLNTLRNAYAGRAMPWLGLGWACATLFSRAIFNVYRCFPHLFCYGSKGSGKTSFASMMMRGFFGIETPGKGLGATTDKAAIRLLAKRCSMPVWFDEFRDRGSERHVAAFNSLYNRQGYGRAKRTGDLKTDAVTPNGTLILSGIAPPSDESLQSRCIYLPFAHQQRDRDAFKALTPRIGEMNEIMAYCVRNQRDLTEPVLAAIESAITRLLPDADGDDRMAINYGIALGAFEACLGAHVEPEPVQRFCREAVSVTRARLEEEDPVNDFWDAVQVLATNRPDLVGKAHAAVDGDRVGEEEWAADTQFLFWLRGIWYAFEADFRRRRGCEPQIRFADLRNAIKSQGYVLADQKQRRIDGKVQRCCVVDAALAPPIVVEIIRTIESRRDQRT